MYVFSFPSYASCLHFTSLTEKDGRQTTFSIPLVGTVATGLFYRGQAETGQTTRFEATPRKTHTHFSYLHGYGLGIFNIFFLYMAVF